MEDGSKFFLVYNDTYGVFYFRLKLISELEKRGFKVTVLSPPGSKDKEVKRLGIRIVHYPLDKRKLNVLKDIISFFSLLYYISREKPHIVQSFTLKPNIFSPIACKIAGIDRVYPCIAGLGHIFGEGSNFLKKIIVKILLKISFKFSKTIVFQNHGDLFELFREGIIQCEKVKVIRGSGVDLKRFNKGCGRKVVHVARLIIPKGIREFAEVAESVGKALNAEFILVGPYYPDNPESIEKDSLEGWIREGFIKYLGEREDIENILKESAVLLFPSYYREGVPKTILEAGASFLPVVCFDIHGTREVIEDKRNGYLIKLGDTKGLKSTVICLLTNNALRRKIGFWGRKKVERDFREDIIVSKYIEAYR